jgi:hypothetical protein
MSNVLQVFNVDEAATARKQRSIRDAVGKALGKAHPTVPWYVSVPEDCSVVQFYCPTLTSGFGMTLHANRPNFELARMAVMMAGEYLERFNVSRERPDISHVPKNIKGVARNEAKGEL